MIRNSQMARAFKESFTEDLDIIINELEVGFHIKMDESDTEHDVLIAIDDGFALNKITIIETLAYDVIQFFSPKAFDLWPNS